jgi:hypothetical protein
MPWLRVKNLTKDWIVFDGVLGLVPMEGIRTVFVKVEQVENLRTSLVSLQEQGLIEFNVFNTLEIEDDDAEYVTLADIKRLISDAVGSTGSATAGFFILRPGSLVTYPNNIVFSTWATLYPQLVANGGGIVIIDDSLAPGGIVSIPPGSYDFSGVILEGLGNSQPTVKIENGVTLANNSLRFINLNLLFDNASPLITVSGALDSFVQFINSKITMLSTGDLIRKVSGSTGQVDLVLEGSLVNPASSTGYLLRVDAGEIAEIAATKCSKLSTNTVAGSGDIDAIRDSNSVISRSQSALLGSITVTLCTGITRKYGIQLSGIKNSINRLFFTTDNFIHDSLLGETIVVHHNGRKLRQSFTGGVTGGEYIPFESGGSGTGYDSVYLLSFSPNSYSNLEADYLPA